jgi:hypothetical protein
MSKVVFEDVIKASLLRNPALTEDSDMIKDPGLNAGFRAAQTFMDPVLTGMPDRLRRADRDHLFKSTVDLISRVSYLKDRTGSEKDQEGPNVKPLSYEDRVADWMVGHFCRIYDLAVVTNNQKLTKRERRAIKGAIEKTYNLTGWDKKMWDEFTITVSPYYGATLEFYYNMFKAYPNTDILLGSTSRYVYRNSDWGGAADKAIVCLATGSMEFGTHGIGHNIIGYLQRNEQAGKHRIGHDRAIELRDAMEQKEARHLPAQTMGYTGIEKYWGWWGAPMELWATLVGCYLVDTPTMFRVALEGPTQRLDQFLYIFDVFSLEKNTGYFYFFNNRPYPYNGPGNKRGWFEFINKSFTVTKTPLTRNSKGWITSLTWDGKTYKFDLDDKGSVTRWSSTASR